MNLLVVGEDEEVVSVVEIDGVVVQKRISDIISQQADLEDLGGISFLILEDGDVFVVQDSNDFPISGGIVHREAEVLLLKLQVQLNDARVEHNLVDLLLS